MCENPSASSTAADLVSETSGGYSGEGLSVTHHRARSTAADLTALNESKARYKIFPFAMKTVREADPKRGKKFVILK